MVKSRDQHNLSLHKMKPCYSMSHIHKCLGLLFYRPCGGDILSPPSEHQTTSQLPAEKWNTNGNNTKIPDTGWVGLVFRKATRRILASFAHFSPAHAIYNIPYNIWQRVRVSEHEAGMFQHVGNLSSRTPRGPDLPTRQQHCLDRDLPRRAERYPSLGCGHAWEIYEKNTRRRIYVSSRQEIVSEEKELQLYGLGVETTERRQWRAWR